MLVRGAEPMEKRQQRRKAHPKVSQVITFGPSEKLIEHQVKLQFIHIRIINTIFLKKPFL